MSNDAKPKLLFLRFSHPDLPSFIKLHLHEQVLCLSQWFDVIVNDDHACDYKQLCETHEPDIAMFESGVSVGLRNVSNVSACPTVPKIGFFNCDAYCPTRASAISDMARWEISTFFGISVSLGSYTPSIADNLFVWPNFVNPELYRDYSFPKVIPILFSGSQASHYPWRSRIDRIVSQHYPSLHSPYFWKKGKPKASSFLEGEKYAQLINAAWVAPTCGTIANEAVRKHFEIPACNTCLLTEKSAALQAAGFADLENCVFADDIDVLDKLHWLFQTPDELDRITRAGKQLVDSRHTMRQRDQIFQWYNLHRKLKPGQKIIQSGPFLPLTIVEQNSGLSNGHVPSGGLDRLLMTQADELMRSGKYNDAERLYRRCLNYYVYPDIPEAKFRLVLCLLYQGNSKAALAIVRKHFVSHRLSRNDGFEPDPTEWAWFILVLLCCGKNREAALRANQFTSLHNEELHRVRRVVRTLCGQKNEIQSDMSRTDHRASIHQPFGFAMDEWQQSVERMLQACGQIEIAGKLATASSKLQLLEVNESSNKESQDSTIADDARKNLAYMNTKLASVPKQRSFGNLALESYLAAGSRFNHFAQKITSRSHKLVRRISGYVHHGSSSIAKDDRAAIVRLLQKEDITSGVLIGAANGSWFSDAFLRGMQDNPNMPAAVCVNYNTPDFRRLHGRYVDQANVEFRYLPRDGGVFEPNATFDVVAVHCSDILELRYKTTKATLLLLDCINSQAGSELFRAMLSDENYLLVAHEPSQHDGYAVFRRVAVKAAHSERQDTALQESDMRKWLEVNANGTPIEWYCDKASGKTMDRPGWQKREGAIVSRRVSAIVI